MDGSVKIQVSTVDEAVKKFSKALAQKIGKEKISNRLIDRLALSSDAGFYRLVPKLIVRPNCSQDIQHIFHFANTYKVAVVFRAAGTSLSGQSISDSVLVDISRSFRSVHTHDNAQTVLVEPGVIGAAVNRYLSSYSKKIGPDPASIQAAMMGGILANNSSGMCCGVKDNSYHTLVSLQATLPNGFSFDSASVEDEKKLQELHPHIYQGILDIRLQILSDESLQKKIRHKYKIKNTVGYSMNAFLDYQRPLEILAHLLIGSEGTLGFIHSAQLRTIVSEPYKLTCLLLFETIALAGEAVPFLQDAASVELMDRSSIRSIEEKVEAESAIIGQALKNLEESAAVLLVEYEFSTKEKRLAARDSIEKKFASFVLKHPPFMSEDAKEQALYWSLRKGLYPSVGSLRQVGTIALIEDVAVETKHLASFVVDLQNLFSKYKYSEAIIFGHAKDGNLHFVITPSFEQTLEIERYEKFMNDVVVLTLHKYNGSLKGEHGTGRNMAPFVEAEWGRELYEYMQKLKQLLDPLDICNPGVILNDDKNIHIKNFKQLPAVDGIVDLCIECGFCENNCPSRDLTLTPRQRISLSRHFQSDWQITQKEKNRLKKQHQYMALDTCATDGLCALACPVGIDTGMYVKKLREQSHKNLSKTVASFAATQMKRTTASLRFVLKSIRRFALSSVLKKTTLILRKIFAVLGFASFPVFLKNIYAPRKNSKKLLQEFSYLRSGHADFLYFPTCISRTMGGYNEKSDLQELVLRLSKKAGYNIKVPREIDNYCCGMPFSSKGFSQAADEINASTLDMLYKESNNGSIPIVVDASSCTYTFLQKNKNVPLQIIDISEFAAVYLLPHLPVRRKQKSAVLHIPCAARKISVEKYFKQITDVCCEESLYPEHNGCCGMAGDRGMLFPELTKSATRREIAEVNQMEHNGYYSSNRTCESALSETSGHEYLSILHLLEYVSEEN